MSVPNSRVAIVTGASSGIGLVTARLLSREGFRVGLVGRRVEALNALADEIQVTGGEAWTGVMDVRDELTAGVFIQDAVQRYGSIDLLVHSAGVFRMVPFEETGRDFWEETLAVNLTGAYIWSQAVWPHIAGGQIIHISSVAGVQPFPGCAAYSASKYGLIGLSEVLALEGSERGIRVHVVCPGNTRTSIWNDQAPPEIQARFMQPDRVAEVVRWLAVSPPEVAFEKVIIRPSVDPWGE